MAPKGPCSTVSQGLAFLLSCQKLCVIRRKKSPPTHL